MSVKLTQLGLAIDEELACRHLKLLCACAAQHHNFVRVDMEGSAFTEATLRVFRTVNAPRDVAGIVIQSYLYRSDKDVEELLKGGARIRLVKGAYNEPPNHRLSPQEGCGPQLREVDGEDALQRDLSRHRHA